MSEQTPAQEAPSPNLRDTKRQRARARRTGGQVVPIKKAPAKKAPAKAPAKKAPAAKKTTAPAPPRSPDNPRFTRAKYQAKQGEVLYQATSRAGKINVRGSATPYTHALDVADDKAPREDAKLGLIWGFVTSEEAAKKAAAELTAKGYDVKIVPAVKYTG